MSTALDLSYPNILKQVHRYLQDGRTESHAFLAWFLEHYYRLEDFQALDAVCDGFDDKGVDAIYVDDNFERIDIFQSKIVQNSAKTLGDTQIKEFVGALDQFRTASNVNHIAASTTNTELKKILQSEKVADKVASGYTIRGIFLTNIKRDANAKQYLATRDDIVVYDHDELEKSYVPAEPTPPVQTPFVFDTFGYDTPEYKVGQAKVVLAPLLGSELIKLDGLANGELFAWNVRKTLGKSKVNKDIAKSIDSPEEHKNFLLFHNGLTVLCERVERRDTQIEIQGYAVVNGCQSLTTLYENKSSVSKELRLLARLIELPPNDPLSERITHHSNNQNPISARDLQSNSTLQRRLQNEFATKYPSLIFYQIKRGEAAPPLEMTIDNEEAGRVLLAFDLQEPWSCHQSWRVFDEFHAEIFARPEVTAARILALWTIYGVIESALGANTENLMGKYRLTRYVLLYLLRRALELDPLGKAFCAAPSTFLAEASGRKRLKNVMQKVVLDLLVDLNGEYRERAESSNPLDYKREFKSQNAVKELEKNIISLYRKAVSRKRASSFGDEWKQSAEQSAS